MYEFRVFFGEFIMNMGAYKTTDIYLAAYLRLEGKNFIGVSRESARRAKFIFMEDCSVEADEFYNGDGKMFLDYARMLKDTKSQMYNTLESNVKEANPNVQKDLKYKLQ